MSVYLHIGLHKTGTSSLQAFLKANKEALAEQGYAIPSAGWAQGGHHNPAYELLGKARFDPAAGGVEALVADCGGQGHAIVSSEEFEFLDLDGVRRLRDAFGDTQVRPLVYLRRQDRLIGSTFAQQIKMGAKLPPLEDYARNCLYEPRFDFHQLLNRWAAIFGKDSLIVGVISAETSGDLLFADFLSRIGASGEGLRTPRKLNTSPSWSEVELVRRVAWRLKRKGRKLEPAEMGRVRTACYDAVAADEALQSGRITLPEDIHARVEARFAPGNRKVAAEFVASDVQRAALDFEPWAAPERPLPRQKLMGDAVDRLVAMLEAELGEPATAANDKAQPPQRARRKAAVR